MPELVPNGPIIPVHLMNEVDSGRVVFFCGAGISAGVGSELPVFSDLVMHVYEANRMEGDAVEREALDLEEKDPARRRPNFDKALGLLERKGRLGAQALRRTVIERLTEDPTGPLHVHKALIDLSRNQQGFRLITTNFDNRFVEAGLDERLVDTAPKLPVPKRHNWSSLVHLHGRITPDDDGSNLVLTAADFGRAYLTEQWAARFVAELFREFIVVFVGYSIDDPVMSYMVDALAAETGKGARIEKAFAFADYDDNPVGLERARDGWLAKNVVPILYDRRDNHRLLAETMIEWARIRKDPFFARSHIAINEITKMPAGVNDPVVERVIWALQDPVAAKALADEPPITEEDDFPKVERWLDMFAEKGLLVCVPADVNEGGGNQDPPVVQLVSTGHELVNPHTLDRTRAHMARWMARHLHVPQLFSWAIRNGGHLHPGLRQHVEEVLAATDLQLPSRLRLLWTILLDNKPADPWEFVWTSDRYNAATSESEHRRIESEAVERIAPRLVVRPGPTSRMKFRRYYEQNQGSIGPLDSCGHLKLVAGDRDIQDQIENILGTAAALSRHAEKLTGYLEQALVLGEEDEDVYPDSSLFRPSIAKHEQNQDQNGWTFLIDLVRDSYFALAAADHARGDNLLRRWVLSGKPLFKRLALHAITENTKSDIHLTGKLLVSGRNPGVWEWELRREVLRFFRLGGSRLPRTLRVEIVRVIHAGPKGKVRRSLRPESIPREKALRLHKLSLSGARLDRKSRALAQEAETAADGDLSERDEFSQWQTEGGWIGDEEFAPKGLVQGSIGDVVPAVEEEKVGRDGYRGLVRVKPVKTALALRRLAIRGKWPAAIWQEFLWGLPGRREQEKRNLRLQEYVARLLAAAPGELIANIGSAAADFVIDLAEEYGIDREREFGTLWTKAWGGVGKSLLVRTGRDDPLSDALNHPAGKLAEAALDRLGKYEPEIGAGLPQPVLPYFNAIGVDPGGHLGRVMLATRLHYLFTIDSDWTREHLIVRLSPSSTEEATDLWSVYGWSPRVGPELLIAFKEPFLQVLCDDPGDRQGRKNLIGLFVSICLEAPNQFTPREIHGVVQAMSENALVSVIESMTRRLRGEAAERGQIWQDKVHPWFQDYWPPAEVRNTTGTSNWMLAMLAECGKAFPEAAEWSLPYLRPVTGHDLLYLSKNDHPEQHPDWMLQVLSRVAVEDILPVHQRPILRRILDTMKAANPVLTPDPRFQGLYRIATQ